MNADFDIIPALDIINGKIVRLHQGDYSKKTSYALDALSLIESWQELGIRRVHLVDLDAAKTGESNNFTLLARLVKHFPHIAFDVGGGIRSLAMAKRFFECGVAFINLGSVYIQNQKIASEIIENYPHKVFVSLDARGEKLAAQGWLETSQLTLQEALELGNKQPLAGFVYTDIDKDGTLAGPQLQRFSSLLDNTQHKIILSGGVASNEDILEAKKIATGHAAGVISGKAILEGRVDLAELMEHLKC